MYGPLAPAPDGSPSDGIVYLAPNDGAGHGAADIATPITFQPVRLGGEDAGPILRTHTDSDGALTGVIIAPSKRPPRA